MKSFHNKITKPKKSEIYYQRDLSDPTSGGTVSSSSDELGIENDTESNTRWDPTTYDYRKQLEKQEAREQASNTVQIRKTTSLDKSLPYRLI